MLIGRDSSCLLVVDIQEKLLPAMQDPMLVVRNAGILMQAAARLGIPILVSEQYPQGLGPTVAELRHLAPADAVLAKTAFSCADDPGLRQRLADLKRPQAIICGIEAHVCVLQTALGLAGQNSGNHPNRHRRRHVVAHRCKPRSRAVATPRRWRGDRDNRNGGIRVARKSRDAGIQGTQPADPLAAPLSSSAGCSY